MTGLLFVAALLAAILAAVFYFQWRSSTSTGLTLRGEADAFRVEAEAARAEQRRLQEELRRQRELLADTREKLTDTRRKAQDTRVQKQQQSRSSRESELEEDLGNARRLAEDAHAAEAAARRERDEAREAAQRAKAELEKAHERLRGQPAAPVAAAPVAPVAPPPPDFVEARKELEAKAAAAHRELEEARAALQEAKKKEQDLREDVRRYRGRAETNNRVYLVTKGELELTKERLAHAERKLWQAGIPLAPPEKKDRPRATGPAAAERPGDAGSQGTPAGDPAESSGQNQG